MALLRVAGRALCLLPCILSTGAPAAGDARPAAILKVSVAAGPTLPIGKAGQRWAALLTETGDERLAANLHPGAALAERDASREFAALKEGRTDLAVGSTLQWSQQVPALGVFSLPWVAPEDWMLETLAADGPLRSALAARLDAQGVVLVAIAPLGYREIAATAGAIRAPADLAGLRIRASPAPLVHEMLLALGALPQAMPFAEAQAAFARGALDGQEGMPSALAAARAIASGQRHLTDWGAIAEAMVFAVRKPVWQAWSDGQREAVRRASHQAIGETGALARERAALLQLAQRGVAVVRITPAGHEAFRAAVNDVSARWREAIGADVVDLAEKALPAPSGGPPLAPPGALPRASPEARGRS